MQDAPWQAWSHACACRTLPGKLGHMPSHAGRSLGQAWSHAAAYRTLPDRASLGHRQSGLIRKQTSNMKQNETLMLFRFNSWSSSAGGSPYISVQCMCKQILSFVTASADDTVVCTSPEDCQCTIHLSQSNAHKQRVSMLLWLLVITASESSFNLLAMIAIAVAM